MNAFRVNGRLGPLGISSCAGSNRRFVVVPGGRYLSRRGRSEPPVGAMSAWAVHRMLAPVGLVTVLALAACGGGGSDGTTGSDPGSTSTTRAATHELSAAALQRLDYQAAIAQPADLEFYGTFQVRDSFDMKDTNVRKQCGETAKSPAYAVEGAGLQLVDADNLISLNTGVQAFASEAAAKSAFAFARRSAEGCTTWSSDGDQFTTVRAPSIPDAGDETLSLFSRKNDTQLLVADHFVRRGQFVFNLRYAVDGTSALASSPGALSEIARADDERFVAWVDHQQS